MLSISLIFLIVLLVRVTDRDIEPGNILKSWG